MSAPVDGDDDEDDNDNDSDDDEDDDDDYVDDSVDNEDDDEEEEKKINLGGHPDGWHVDKFRLAFIVEDMIWRLMLLLERSNIETKEERSNIEGNIQKEEEKSLPGMKGTRRHGGGKNI